LKTLEKEGVISEDDSRRAQTDVQQLTDKYIKEIDDLLAAKEKEIMEVCAPLRTRACWPWIWRRSWPAWPPRAARCASSPRRPRRARGPSRAGASPGCPGAAMKRCWSSYLR